MNSDLNLTLDQARHICTYFFGVSPWQARPVKTSGDHILLDNGNHYQFTGSMSDKSSWDLIMPDSVPLPIPAWENLLLTNTIYSHLESSFWHDN